MLLTFLLPLVYLKLDFNFPPRNKQKQAAPHMRAVSTLGKKGRGSGKHAKSSSWKCLWGMRMWSRGILSLSFWNTCGEFSSMPGTQDSKGAGQTPLSLTGVAFLSREKKDKDIGSHNSEQVLWRKPNRVTGWVTGWGLFYLERPGRVSLSRRNRPKVLNCEKEGAL